MYSHQYSTCLRSDTSDRLTRVSWLLDNTTLVSSATISSTGLTLTTTTLILQRRPSLFEVSTIRPLDVSYFLKSMLIVRKIKSAFIFLSIPTHICSGLVLGFSQSLQAVKFALRRLTGHLSCMIRPRQIQMMSNKGCLRVISF